MPKMTAETYMITKGWFRGGVKELQKLIKSGKVDGKIFGPVLHEIQAAFADWEIKAVARMAERDHGSR